MSWSKKICVSLLALSAVLAATLAAVSAMPPAPEAQARPVRPKTAAPVPVTIGVSTTTNRFAFIPDEVHLPASGGSVLWTNSTGVTHTVTSDDDGKTFDKTLGRGETFQKDFPPGNYTITYHCNIHPSFMTGKVVVGNGAEKRTKPAAKKAADKSGHAPGK